MLPADFVSQDFPELAVSLEQSSPDSPPEPTGSVFASVQEAAAATPALDALLGVSEPPAGETMKRRGLFGRKRKDDEEPKAAPVAAGSPFAAVTVPPVDETVDGAPQEPIAEAYAAPDEAYAAPDEAYAAPDETYAAA